MAREKLFHYCGRRMMLTGTFVRYGYNKLDGSVTALLVEITDERGEVVSDHNWIVEAGVFEKLEVVEGDRVAFTARIRQYVYGTYPHDFDQDTRHDYRLEGVRSAHIIKEEQHENQRDQREHRHHRQHGRPQQSASRFDGEGDN